MLSRTAKSPHRPAVKPLGVEVRTGTHTGEIAFGEDDLAGIGIHVAARVASMAGASEVWASSTVKDLTAGSGLAFEDAGEHELKGVPDVWRLLRGTKIWGSVPRWPSDSKTSGS